VCTGRHEPSSGQGYHPAYSSDHHKPEDDPIHSRVGLYPIGFALMQFDNEFMKLFRNSFSFVPRHKLTAFRLDIDKQCEAATLAVPISFY
jgi:hypothetical protein